MLGEWGRGGGEVTRSGVARIRMWDNLESGWLQRITMHGQNQDTPIIRIPLNKQTVANLENTFGCGLVFFYVYDVCIESS